MRLLRRLGRRRGGLWRALAEAESEGVCAVDADDRIVCANETLARLLGVTAESLRGRRLTELALEGSRTGGLEQLLLRRAGGPPVWTLVARHPLPRGREVLLVTDIDALKDTERSLHGATRRLGAIVAAQREIAELELDLDAVLLRLAERTQELAGADGARLYVVDGDDAVVRAGSGTGAGPGDLGRRVPLDGSLVGLAARSSQVQTTLDAESDPRVSPLRPRSAASAVVVPIVAGEETQALLVVLYSERAGFDDEAVETTRLMAEFASAALRNAAELRAKQELLVALVESEERFRNAVESSPIGFALCTPDDRYVVVNEAFCRITGRSRKELEGLTWRDITHPDDVDVEAPLTAQLIAGAIPHFEVEKRFVRGDGSAIWTRMLISLARTREGEPYYGVAQVQDITEQRQLEQSVRERERLFRAVFEQSQIAHILYDDEGRIVDANRSAAELAQLPREALLGRRFLEFAPPGDDFGPLLDETLAQGQSVGERELLTARGQRRTVLFATRANVQPGRHISLIQDVTEQRELEERLRQGQKMEAVGRLAGGIAHDFNNMLTAINGYSELLLGKLEPESQLRRHAHEIHQAGIRAAALTRQLLTFSRRQVLQPTVVDLNDAIERMRDMIQRLVGEDVQVETLLAPDAAPVLADESQMQQVVVNLAANARDAMPTGGLLRIETATVTVDPEQASEAVATPGRYTRLSVGDTGIGMGAEQLARLFEPFYSTKGEAGVGLGLATVYGAVRQSGGFVTVDSEPDRGSVFRVFLPVTALPQAEEPDAGDDAAAGASDATVLLVEDEELVRTIVREMLEESGYRVLTAARGEDAVRVAVEEAGSIDVLVTDVVMPGMSGQDVARSVAERRPEIRTLFVSGYNDSAIDKHGVLAPGTVFLQKPFAASDLAAKLRELLEAAPVA